MVKRRVAVVFGGVSVEREVSRVSARTILDGLSASFIGIPVGIDAAGRFRNEEDSRILLERGFDSLPAHSENEDPWRLFRGVDAAFPIVHGEAGEDGTLQGFFETIGLPYVGSGVSASALGMNKIAFKARMREAGIPVARSIAVSRREWAESAPALADTVARRFALPVFVKPSNGGSSLGITKIKDWSDLPGAAALAFEYDEFLLVEEGVDAREIETAILGNDEPEASGCAEIIPGREFYDYEDKYLSSARAAPGARSSRRGDGSRRAKNGRPRVPSVRLLGSRAGRFFPGPQVGGSAPERVEHPSRFYVHFPVSPALGRRRRIPAGSPRPPRTLRRRALPSAAGRFPSGGESLRKSGRASPDRPRRRSPARRPRAQDPRRLPALTLDPVALRI